MASETQPEASGRKYRSKKQRPCDLCRSRKIHCKVPGNESVCECCKRLNRVCTFELEPLKRRHRPDGAGTSAGSASGDAAVGGLGPGLGLGLGAGLSAGLNGGLSAGLGAGLSLGLSSPTAATIAAATATSTTIAATTAPAPTPLPTTEEGQQHADAMLLEQHAAALANEHGDTAMALDMPPFWMAGDAHEPATTTSHFFSPRGMSEIDQLLMQSPLTMLQPHRGVTTDHSTPGISPGISPGSGTDSTTSPMNGFSHLHTSNGHVDRDPVSAGAAAGTTSTATAPATTTAADNQVPPWLLPDWPEDFSMEKRRGYSHHHIGLSCESDPFLLRFYEYNARDLYAMFRLDYRRMLDDASGAAVGPLPLAMGSSSSSGPPPPAGYMPVQFALTHESVLRDGIKETEGVFANAGGGTEQDDLALVHRLVPADLGARLVRLYTLCVHPRFPVLSLADLAAVRSPEDGVPVGLLSAVYALAMPFTFLDDELSLFKGYLQVPTDDLWAVAQRSFARASCLSHLSLLQLCLLLLQRPPYNYAVAGPPAVWALSCSALAIAETLGVNLDPSAWRLPRAEVVLRRRLWWLTYTQHVWHAVGLARPCHLHDANWDVDPLTADDFETDHADADVRDAMAAEVPILLAHSQLSTIAADVLREFYTFKSVRETTTLSVLLARAQPLRARIESWRQTLPLLSAPALDLTEDDLVIGASLRLAHLTLEILIFRALLRPLQHDAVPVSGADGLVAEPMSTIYENCFTCAKVGMEIIASMKGKHFSTFWPCYIRYQLCYISNFILLSLAQSPTRDMAVRSRALLNRWRDTLRTQARAWPLARLATIRLDAIFWKGLASVVLGTGPDSPAVKLLREGRHDSG